MRYFVNLDTARLGFWAWQINHIQCVNQNLILFSWMGVYGYADKTTHLLAGVIRFTLIMLNKFKIQSMFPLFILYTKHLINSLHSRRVVRRSSLPRFELFTPLIQLCLLFRRAGSFCRNFQNLQRTVIFLCPYCVRRWFEGKKPVGISNTYTSTV